MTESNLPLLQHGRITATATYADVLKIESDSDRSIYIRGITIVFGTLATTCNIKVIVNGEPLMKDFIPLVATTTLSFGGDLVFHGKTVKPPIHVQAKDSAGSIVTCIVSGIQKPYRR